MGIWAVMAWGGWQIFSPPPRYKLDKIAKSNHFRALKINQSTQHIEENLFIINSYKLGKRGICSFLVCGWSKVPSQISQCNSFTRVMKNRISLPEEVNSIWNSR